MRKLLIILSLFPGFVVAQQSATSFYDSLLQQQASQGFSGVLLVAEKGAVIYNKAVCR